MNIFINAVSRKWAIILFDDNRQVVSRHNIEVLMNESSVLLEEISTFIDKNDIKWNDLNNIVVINGPWSFTGLRTIALIVNTINYIIKKDISPISYFELFESYPIVKSSSKRDIFIKKNKEGDIEIISNDECGKYIMDNNIDKVYWDLTNNFLTNTSLFEDINYEKIIKHMNFDNQKIIKPLYIKKPNIS